MLSVLPSVLLIFVIIEFCVQGLAHSHIQMVSSIHRVTCHWWLVDIATCKLLDVLSRLWSSRLRFYSSHLHFSLNYGKTTIIFIYGIEDIWTPNVIDVQRTTLMFALVVVVGATLKLLVVVGGATLKLLLVVVGATLELYHFICVE